MIPNSHSIPNLKSVGCAYRPSMFLNLICIGLSVQWDSRTGFFRMQIPTSEPGPVSSSRGPENTKQQFIGNKFAVALVCCPCDQTALKCAKCKISLYFLPSAIQVLIATIDASLENLDR